jgi:hypothetical protein
MTSVIVQSCGTVTITPRTFSGRILDGIIAASRAVMGSKWLSYRSRIGTAMVSGFMLSKESASRWIGYYMRVLGSSNTGCV